MATAHKFETLDAYCIVWFFIECLSYFEYVHGGWDSSSGLEIKKKN